MKILHVIPDLMPATGGPVTAVLGMAEAEAALGHEVTIAATDYGLKDPPVAAGVQITVYRCTFSGWRWSPGLARALPGLVASSDIVHIHTVWEHPAWAAAGVCRKLAKPYVLSPCGMLTGWCLSQSALKKKAYLRFAAAPVIRSASAMHFTTEEEMAASLTFGNEDRCIIVPGGLHAEVFHDLPDAGAFCRRFPELENKRIVLFLGRLHYVKQPDVVIKAFSRVSGIDDRLALAMAGPAEPAYLAKLKSLAAELGLAGKVIFTGLLQGDAVREAFGAAELFVLPSRHENFGIAVAEAMAAGCPVVISPEVNLAGEVRAANAGIVSKSDPISTASAMERLIDNKHMRVEMGKSGRILALEKFTWFRVAVDLIAVYEDILSSRQTSRAWSKKIGS